MVNELPKKKNGEAKTCESDETIKRKRGNNNENNNNNNETETESFSHGSFENPRPRTSVKRFLERRYGFRIAGGSPDDEVYCTGKHYRTFGYRNQKTTEK